LQYAVKMQAIFAGCSVPEDRNEYLKYLKRANRHHWNHVGHRIIGKPVVLIPKHTGTLIVFQLITLVCLLLAFCFTLVAFNHFEVTTEAAIPRLYSLHPRYEDVIKADNATVPHKDTTWEELKKAGDLALIGFCFIIASQGFMAATLLCGTCYRCWRLKRPARTWEVMPFCIGSFILLLAGSLECYYATSFKKLDDELPYHIKESWLLAAVLTLVGAFLSILDTCLLLGSEARITGPHADVENATAEQVEQNKALMDNE